MSTYTSESRLLIGASAIGAIGFVLILVCVAAWIFMQHFEKQHKTRGRSRPTSRQRHYGEGEMGMMGSAYSLESMRAMEQQHTMEMLGRMADESRQNEQMRRKIAQTEFDQRRQVDETELRIRLDRQRKADEILASQEEQLRQKLHEQQQFDEYLEQKRKAQENTQLALQQQLEEQQRLQSGIRAHQLQMDEQRRNVENMQRAELRRQGEVTAERTAREEEEKIRRREHDERLKQQLQQQEAAERRQHDEQLKQQHLKQEQLQQRQLQQQQLQQQEVIKRREHDARLIRQQEEEETMRASRERRAMQENSDAAQRLRDEQLKRKLVEEERVLRQRDNYFERITTNIVVSRRPITVEEGHDNGSYVNMDYGSASGSTPSVTTVTSPPSVHGDAARMTIDPSDDRSMSRVAQRVQQQHHYAIRPPQMLGGGGQPPPPPHHPSYTVSAENTYATLDGPLGHPPPPQRSVVDPRVTLSHHPNNTTASFNQYR